MYFSQHFVRLELNRDVKLMIYSEVQNYSTKRK